jgi:hypothetical protein
VGEYLLTKMSDAVYGALLAGTRFIRYVAMLSDILTLPAFYFSYTYDLTQNMNRECPRFASRYTTTSPVMHQNGRMEYDLVKGFAQPTEVANIPNISNPTNFPTTVTTVGI